MKREINIIDGYRRNSCEAREQTYKRHPCRVERLRVKIAKSGGETTSLRLAAQDRDVVFRTGRALSKA